MKFIKRFWDWGWGIFFAHKELFLYLIFGGLTTLVNWLAYYGIYFLVDWHYQIINVIAWAVAVAFAYITNRLLVFTERAHGVKMILVELGAFVAARIFSLGAEAAMLWLMVDVLTIGELIAKIPAAVVVVLLNYVFSKLFIFRERGTVREDQAQAPTPDGDADKMA